MMNKNLVIAVDGHSSCGKSSFAKSIAKKYGLIYIDSGAMYRAVTLYGIEKGLFSAGNIHQNALIEALPSLSIRFTYNPSLSRYETWLNGRNVEENIRHIEVSARVSQVAKIREVRQQLVQMQRDVGKNKGIVMDGRDIGTVVFPQADLKIFMTASLEVRTGRRYKELIGKGEKVSREEVMENLRTRDQIDSTREESPLRQAPDALVLDNSFLTPGEQMEWLENILIEKGLA